MRAFNVGEAYGRNALVSNTLIKSIPILIISIIKIHTYFHKRKESTYQTRQNLEQVNI